MQMFLRNISIKEVLENIQRHPFIHFPLSEEGVTDPDRMEGMKIIFGSIRSEKGVVEIEHPNEAEEYDQWAEGEVALVNFEEGSVKSFTWRTGGGYELQLIEDIDEEESTWLHLNGFNGEADPEESKNFVPFIIEAIYRPQIEWRTMK